MNEWTHKSHVENITPPASLVWQKHISQYNSRLWHDTIILCTVKNWQVANLCTKRTE